LLTYPIISYILPAIREEPVGGTRPWPVVFCERCLWAGPTRGGEALEKKDLAADTLDTPITPELLWWSLSPLHVRAHCSIGIPIPDPMRLGNSRK